MAQIHDPTHVAPHWFDNWGSLLLPSGELCFVSEPHLSYPPDRTTMIVPHLLAMVVDARLLILPESERPHAIRLLFKAND